MKCDAELRADRYQKEKAEAKQQLQGIKQENRLLALGCQEKENEILSFQSQYEEVIASKEIYIVEIKAQQVAALDKFQFEIEYLREQLQEQMRQGEIAKLKQAEMRISGENIFKRSVGSDIKPSPYIQAFVKSNFKGSNDFKGLNDSLDKMQREFFQGYNEVMQESDNRMAGFKSISRKTPNLQDAQSLKEENEQLLRIVDQMKVDMEAMVNKVRSEFNQKNDPAIEEALARKTKRVFELEIKCRNLEDKVASLMHERDKLAEISSDLRADLNRCQRFVDDHLEKSPNPKQPNHVVDYNFDIFSSLANR